MKLKEIERKTIKEVKKQLQDRVFLETVAEKVGHTPELIEFIIMKYIIESI